MTLRGHRGWRLGREEAKGWWKGEHQRTRREPRSAVRKRGLTQIVLKTEAIVEEINAKE